MTRLRPTLCSPPRLATLLLACATGCAGASQGAQQLDLVPPSATVASLVSARCDEGGCRCRDEADRAAEDPPPEPGLKRFELRVGSGPGEVWITVNNAQKLVKSKERSESCFYLDLAPGKHEVTLYGVATTPGGGVGATLDIHEYGPAPGWYDTFAFECGLPGPCDTDTLRDWKRQVDGYPRGLRDRCGSTKLRGAQWQTGRLPDGEHPDEVVASVVLDVYTFTPEHGPGQCGTPSP